MMELGSPVTWTKLCNLFMLSFLYVLLHVFQVYACFFKYMELDFIFMVNGIIF